MRNLNCVVRVCKDENSETLWTALYIDGKKMVEANYFNVEEMVKRFTGFTDYIEDIFIEYDKEYLYDYIETHFPEEDDFTHLMDMRGIKEGNIVYLYDGPHLVEKIWTDYREAGTYNMVMWEKFNGNLICGKYPVKWEGHTVTKFTVKGSKEEYIWEDYNYHQSSIYENLKENGKLV